jgi:hypothetical protein
LIGAVARQIVDFFVRVGPRNGVNGVLSWRARSQSRLLQTFKKFRAREDGLEDLSGPNNTRLRSVAPNGGQCVCRRCSSSSAWSSTMTKLSLALANVSGDYRPKPAVADHHNC